MRKIHEILDVISKIIISYKYCCIAFTLIIFFSISYIFIKRNYRKLHSKYIWKKRKYRKIIFYLRKKYFQQEIFLKKLFFHILGILAYILVLLFFMYSIDVIRTNDNLMSFSIRFNKLTIGEKCYEFLWSQISASLIVSTIVSLLSIFSSSYVYGKKQINVIFNEKSILSLGKMFIYLVILIFISFIICLKGQNDYIILVSFILTLSIVFYMLFKVILFYTHPFFYKNCVKCDYINREKKHIKKAIPLDSHKDNEIENLKEVTMAHIQKNDNEYNVNINAIMNMIEISLLSNSKNIQEYYTEMIMNRTDFISSILEIIHHLIKYNKISEANNLMAELYSRLKFYRIVPVQEYFSHSIICDLINAGKYIGNERESLEHYGILWDIINNSKYLVYLYECEIDLSYCRLERKSIFYFTENTFLEKVYLSITENKFLTYIEKERIYEQLYDNIRLMEHKENFPDVDIRHVWTDELNEEKIEIPLIIKGEPIVLMILKMFEQKDIKNILLYKTMNLSNKLMDYIVTLITLALIEFINKGCIREYVNDLKISKKDIISVYKKSKFYNRIISPTNLKDLYNNFKENYVEHKGHRAYTLLPRLTLTIKVIDNYFYILYKKTDNLEEFNNINRDFKPDENIIKIINELNII